MFPVPACLRALIPTRLLSGAPHFIGEKTEPRFLYCHDHSRKWPSPDTCVVIVSLRLHDWKWGALKSMCCMPTFLRVCSNADSFVFFRKQNRKTELQGISLQGSYVLAHLVQNTELVTCLFSVVLALRIFMSWNQRSFRIRRMVSHPDGGNPGLADTIVEMRPAAFESTGCCGHS